MYGLYLNYTLIPGFICKALDLHLRTFVPDNPTAFLFTGPRTCEVVNAEIRFGIRGCVGDDGKTFPVRVVVETAPTDDTAQDCLDLKNVMKEDRTDPVVREDMAEWMHDAVHSNGNHMLARELFRQAEGKDRRWTPAKLGKAFSLAGLGQARATGTRQPFHRLP